MKRRETGNSQVALHPKSNPASTSRRHQVFLISVLLAVAPVQAFAQLPAGAAQTSTWQNSICPMLETVARSNKLPLEFFARVIWQESRFQSDAVGPITRYGQRAQGIAQFMPQTAAERGLFDPFDPLQALPKSGAFLAELRDEFGNLGLAAAAYNAGPQSVRDFLAGLRDLPQETRQYVQAVTDHPVEDWMDPKQKLSKKGPDSQDATMNCDGLLAWLERTSVQDLTRVNVPSWCRYLHQPNLSVCGSVHASGAPTMFASHLDRRHRASELRASFR
jgi:hypothetical protein